MRVLEVLALLATLVIGTSLTGAEQGWPTGSSRPRRPRIVAPLSNMLTHSPLSSCAPKPALRVVSTHTRVATWNIKAARSAPVDAIADELRAMRADIVALQEVDVRTRRTGQIDEPATLASALGFNYAFAASIVWDHGDYGLAVLSRWPLVHVSRYRLAGADLGEPRIVLDVTLCVAGRPLRLLNHHADRRVAARALGFADVRRIAEAGLGRGVLAVGDMNEYPDGPGIRTLLQSGFIDLGAGEHTNTTAAGRVDYVFADEPVARLASAARVWPSDKSDHNAVLVDLVW